MSLLEVVEIYSGYGKFEILHGVSLQVPEGQIVGIIGPNGSGKSTVLRTAIGLLNPYQGSIKFNGEGVAGLTPKEIIPKGMCMVPQGRPIFPNMTVQENLEIAGIVIGKKIRLNRPEIVYAQFPVLGEKRNRPAGTLSGGQQTMLAIGRALILNPKLVLLDEPSLGLAPKLVAGIYKTILHLRQVASWTLLIVEQNVRQILKISDYAYILSTGKNIYEGTSSSLLSDENVVSLYLGKTFGGR